jgi:hypothetical protein
MSWGMNSHSKTPSSWFWWSLVSSHPLWGGWGFPRSELLPKEHCYCLQPISTPRLFMGAIPFFVSKSYECLMSYSSVEIPSIPTGLLLRSVHQSQARSRPDRYLDPYFLLALLTSDQKQFCSLWSFRHWKMTPSLTFKKLLWTWVSGR